MASVTNSATVTMGGKDGPAMWTIITVDKPAQITSGTHTALLASMSSGKASRP